MVVPVGGEITIFNDSAKLLDYRVALGFARPAWTATVTFDFSSAFDHSKLWTTQFGGAHPEIAGGRLLIKQYGGPPHERVITRRVCVPTDPTLAFKITIIAKFPEEDPVYSQVITVGGLEQSFGVEADPLLVVQGGSTVYGGSAVGREFVHSSGTLDATGFAWDGADHTYEVFWDPNAVGGAGAEKLTVKRDTVLIKETSVAGEAVRPRYVAIGEIMSTIVDADGNAIPGLGTSGVPVTTMSVNSIVIDSNGDGFETQTWPVWTTANAGGTTLDNAAEGERVVIDTVTWAIIPRANIHALSGVKTRTGVDSLAMVLTTPDPADADPINRFQGDIWSGQILLVDARVTDSASSVSSWYRLGAYEIMESRERGFQVSLTATDRPMFKLDAYLSRNYLGLDADQPVIGSIDATNEDYTVPEILEDLVDVADVIHGGSGLGATATSIQNAPVIIPAALDSGGQSLVTTILGLCDNLVLEVWRKFRPTGTERYGQILVNLWTFGTGTSGYTFRGQGAASGNSNIVEPGVELRENRRSGPGQVYYRHDAPQHTPDFLALTKLQTIGTFPSAQYPAEERTLNASIASIAATSFSVLTTWKNAAGTNVFGGLAKFRYMKENGMRRIVTFEVLNHPWLEPTDEIGIEDDRTGLDPADESWVVNTVTWAVRDRVLRSTIEASTSKWADAIERTG